MDLNSFGVAQMDYKTLGPLRMTYFLSAPPWDNLPSPPLPSSSSQFTHTHSEWCCCLPLLAHCLSTWKFLLSVEDIFFYCSGAEPVCIFLGPESPEMPQ